MSIIIHSAHSEDIVMNVDGGGTACNDEMNSLHISYHLHFCSSGEHYNSTVNI